jgi:hypothetical protein
VAIRAVMERAIDDMFEGSRLLGGIGDAHSAMADLHGSDSEECCELAYLYELAIDAAKHDHMPTVRGRVLAAALGTVHAAMSIPPHAARSRPRAERERCVFYASFLAQTK